MKKLKIMAAVAAAISFGFALASCGDNEPVETPIAQYISSSSPNTTVTFTVKGDINSGTFEIVKTDYGTFGTYSGTKVQKGVETQSGTFVGNPTVAGSLTLKFAKETKADDSDDATKAIVDKYCEKLFYEGKQNPDGIFASDIPGAVKETELSNTETLTLTEAVDPSGKSTIKTTFSSSDYFKK